MSGDKSTCWDLIAAAGDGDAAAREDFARRYEGPVRAYLAARWRGNPCAAEADDACQEVFCECFRRGGALEKAAPGLSGGFRAFLYGVARNVALRVERRRARSHARRADDAVELDERACEEAPLSHAFDREWARTLMREAADLHARRAREAGRAAERRFELLRLRFQDGLPIRQIAKRWMADANGLHHEYARARREFKAALLDVVAAHLEGSPEELEAECAKLHELLA